MSETFKRPKNRITIDTRVYDPTLVEVMVAYLQSIGVPFYEDTAKSPIDQIYPYMFWDGSKITQTLAKSENYHIVELGEWINHFKPENVITIVLNKQYSAKVSKKGIEVGCQIFTHEKIEELYNASFKFR